MSAISKCIDLAAFGDGATHDELAEQARLDYGALHTKLAELRAAQKEARRLIHDAADAGDIAAKTWLATYPEE